jgi:hypothetical protein
MSYGSDGLMDDALAFTGQATIKNASVIKGRKWKKHTPDDARYLTGNTKVSEFTWCKAFCLTQAGSLQEMANKIAEVSDSSITPGKVLQRARTIKRFYLWVCLAFMKEKKVVPRRRRGPLGVFYYALGEVRGWIEHLHSLNEAPRCDTCRDTGLTLLNTEWGYCTCKAGKKRRALLLNE